MHPSLFIFLCPVYRNTYIFPNKKEFETLWKFYKLFLWITLESPLRPLHPIPVNVIPVHDCACWLLRDPWERLGPGKMGPQGNGLPCMLERIIFKFKNKYRLLHFSCWVLLTNCVCWRHLDLNTKMSIWICFYILVIDFFHIFIDKLILNTYLLLCIAQTLSGMSIL